MYVAACFLFNDPNKYIEKTYSPLIKEIVHAIDNIDAECYKTKEGKEKTNKGSLLYSPKELNIAFEENLVGWKPHKVSCNYPTNLYTKKYSQIHHGKMPQFASASREIDFVKQKLGLEVQFGKYAFMAYDILGKMVIFKNLGIIDAGIELVPSLSNNLC